MATCVTCDDTGTCPCGAIDCGPKRCPDCYCSSCSESGKKLVHGLCEGCYNVVKYGSLDWNIDGLWKCAGAILLESRRKMNRNRKPEDGGSIVAREVAHSSFMEALHSASAVRRMLVWLRPLRRLTRGKA